jgi:hypothetical protein
LAKKKTNKELAPGGCCICGRLDLDRAHIKTRGAGAGWNSDEYIFLCRPHHIMQSQLNWKRFSERYPIVIKELKSRGWHLVEEFGVWKVRRK